MFQKIEQFSLVVNKLIATTTTMAAARLFSVTRFVSRSNHRQIFMRSLILSKKHEMYTSHLLAIRSTNKDIINVNTKQASSQSLSLVTISVCAYLYFASIWPIEMIRRIISVDGYLSNNRQLRTY